MNDGQFGISLKVEVDKVLSTQEIQRFLTDVENKNTLGIKIDTQALAKQIKEFSNVNMSFNDNGSLKTMTAQIKTDAGDIVKLKGEANKQGEIELKNLQLTNNSLKQQQELEKVKTKHLQSQRELALQISKLLNGKNAQYLTTQDLTKIQNIEKSFKELDATSMSDLNNSLKDTKISMDEISNSANIKRINDTTTGIDNLGQKLKDLGLYVSGAMVIRQLWSTFRDGTQYIRDLDEAYTDVAISMDITRKEFNKWTEDAQEIARANGVSTTSIMDMVKIYATAGEDISVISDKIAGTAMIQNITQFDAETTTSIVNSIIAQFKLMDKEINGTTGNISNAINYLGDNLIAISNALEIDNVKGIQEMASAIDDAGSVVNTAGGTMEWYMGITGALAETMNATGSEVGAAMRMISARTLQQKQAFEELNDTGEDVEIAMANAEKALEEIGVSIRNDTSGELRALEEILGDVASKWDTLTDSTKQFVGEKLAGNNRRSYFESMMENYDRILELQEAGLNSSGELFEANQTRVESLDGQIGQLKVSLEELYSTIITEDGMSFLIKGSDWAVQGITVVTKVLKVTLIPTVVTATAALVAYQVALASTGKSTLINNIVNNTLSMMAGLEKLIVTIKASKAAMMTFGAITGGALIGGAVIATFTTLNEKIAETRTQIEGVTDVAENLDTSLKEIDATDELVEQYKLANEELSTMLVGTDDYIAKQQEINGLKEQLMQYSPEYKSLLENETLELDKQYNIMKNMLDLDSKKSVQEAIDTLPETGTGIEEKRVRDITGNMGNIDQLMQDFITAKSNYEKLLAESANAPAEQMSEIAANLEKARADMETSEKTFMDAMSPLSDSMAWVDNYNDVLEKGIKTFADLDGRNPIILPDGTTEKYQDIVNMYYEIKGLSQDTTENTKEQASILEGIKNMEIGKTFEVDNLNSESLGQLINELRDVESDGEEAETILKQLQSVFEDMPDDIDTLSDAIDYLNGKIKETSEASDMKDLNESYLKALEGLEEAQELLDSFKDGLDVSEMRSLFDSDLMADYNGSLNDTATMLDHIKGKMQELKDQSYETSVAMVLNNNETWEQMTQDMAESLGVQVNGFQNFVNELGGLRQVDIQNAKNSADAQLQTEMSLVKQGALYYAGFINSKGENRKTDMKNVENFLNQQGVAEAATIKQLAEMWAQYYKAKKAEITATIDKFAGDYGDLGNVDPALMSQLNSLNRLNNNMNNYFENIKTGFSGVQASLNQAIANTGSAIGSATKPSSGGKSSKGGSKDSSEKEIADLDLKIDRYYDLQDAINDVNNALKKNQALQESATGAEKAKLMKEEIKLYEEQSKAVKDLLAEQERERKEFEKTIKSYGGSFDGNGDIKNRQKWLQGLQNQVNSLSGSAKEAKKSEIEGLMQVIEAYEKLHNDTIPSTQVEYQQLANTIKKLEKEHLEYVTDLQKNITSAYENEMKKRTEATKSEIEKQKEILASQYDEENYERNLASEGRKLDEIQQQIDSARRDTSESGRLYLQQLMEEFAEQEKVINDMIRDREHELGQSRFDEEIDKLDKELEDALDPKNIADIVNQAIAKGFVTIGNETIQLNKLMSNWLDETGDGLYAVGNLLKSEMIDNLQTVKTLMKDIGILSLGGGRSLNIDYAMNNQSRSIADLTPVTRSTPNVSIGSLLTVEGNVTEDVLPQVESMIRQSEQTITRKISDALDFK